MKFALIFPFTLLIASLLSCGKQEKLSVYSCSDRDDTSSCSKDCVLEEKMKYSFLVNKDERSVMQVIYWKGEQSGSLTLKDCTIFATDSWDCSKLDILEHVTRNDRTKMTNGIYSSYTEIRDSNFKLRNEGEKGLCAK